MNRVVVTGIGFISPLGNTTDELTKNLKIGKNALNEISLFDNKNSKVKFACQADINLEDFFSKKELRRMDRVSAFGILAARDALKDSKLSKEEIKNASIIIGTGIGGLTTIEEESEKANTKGYEKISPFFIPKSIANITSAMIAIDLGLHGYSSTSVTACASSLTAILDAYRHIKDGYNNIVIVGGSEASINRLGIFGFESMKALSTSDDINRASIPFDKERQGFVMGEGAGILVLEEYKQAKKRKAKIYGEIIGAGATTDAYHITAPLESGEFAKRAMEEALASAKIDAKKIEYINAHGTSTKLNDKVESKIYKELFTHANISSTKSMTGHLLGASGALEAIISLIALDNNFIPPTINYKEKDDECPININTKALDKNLTYVMTNSLGFGGHNVSVIFKKVKDEI